uniref:Uncharacterized protein n=1 Tax=Knipowitschia caucasica TaxID=637954 RepID=A0AAV2JV31_KNICA
MDRASHHSRHRTAAGEEVHPGRYQSQQDLMDGETEGEPEDDVIYSKPSLIGKLKVLASKGNGDRYENVQLNSSPSKALVWS